MHKGKVSIIVPLFNAEQYILKCIDSVLEQTYNNIELIIIDDGSTDSSKDIVNKKIAIDKRIIYYYQKNSGPSSARNQGIKLSNGEFLVFLDSDDYLEINGIEKMVKNSLGCDWVIGGYKNVYSNKENAIIPNMTGQYSSKEIYEIFLYLLNNNLFHYTWNKLYRKESLHNIRFDTSLKIGEDLIFNLNYLNVSNKLKVIPEVICNHNQTNLGSITQKYQVNLFETRKLMYRALIKFSEGPFENQQRNLMLETFDAWYFKMIKYCFINIQRKDSRNLSVDKIKEATNIINDQTVMDALLSIKNRKKNSLPISKDSSLFLNRQINNIFFYLIINKRVKSTLIFSKLLHVFK